MKLVATTRCQSQPGNLGMHPCGRSPTSWAGQVGIFWGMQRGIHKGNMLGGRRSISTPAAQNQQVGLDCT